MESVYTSISKSIGWEGGSASYPTLEKAKELLELVKQGDVKAFYEVFNFQRFASLAGDDEELEISNIMFDAFGIGSEKFR